MIRICYQESTLHLDLPKGASGLIKAIISGAATSEPVFSLELGAHIAYPEQQYKYHFSPWLVFQLVTQHLQAR